VKRIPTFLANGYHFTVFLLLLAGMSSVLDFDFFKFLKVNYFVMV
jgi:hypothetical protein